MRQARQAGVPVSHVPRQVLARRPERQPAAVHEHGIAVVEHERRQHLHARDAVVAHVVEQELVLSVVMAA